MNSINKNKMKKIVILLLMVLVTNAFAQKPNLDMFIKQTCKKSLTVKKHFLGKFPVCGFDEVYFVEGFDAKKKLTQRYIVYHKNGNYVASNEFMYWCGEHPLIQYAHPRVSILETPNDVKNLSIKFIEKGMFLVTNVPLHAIKPEANTEVEMTFSSNVSFEDFMTQNTDCK
jgi:hypothetical protein